MEMKNKKSLIAILLLTLVISFFWFEPARGEASLATDPFRQFLESCLARALAADQSIIATAVALTVCQASYEVLCLVNYTYWWF